MLLSAYPGIAPRPRSGAPTPDTSRTSDTSFWGNRIEYSSYIVQYNVCTFTVAGRRMSVARGNLESLDLARSFSDVVPGGRAVFSPSSPSTMVVINSSRVTVLVIPSMEVVQVHSCVDKVDDLIFSPDGEYLLCGIYSRNTAVCRDTAVLCTPRLSAQRGQAKLQRPQGS